MKTSATVTSSNGKPVRMRKRPDTSSETIEKLGVGTRVVVNEQSSDGWSQIVAPDGKTGYMMSEFLVPDEQAQGDEKQPSVAEDEETIKQQLNRIETMIIELLGGVG